MTSTTVSEKRKNNGLPDDIFSYSSDEFYEFIKHSYGDDLAELFSFQAIRNGSHLLITSCDEILLVLQRQSKEINELKRLCCFQVDDNTYEIKLGVRLAINNLIQSIKMKHEEQNKRKYKRSPTQRLSSSVGTLTSVDQTRSQNVTISAPSTVLSPPTDDALSTPSKLTPQQNNSDEIDHVTNIKQRINRWWCDANDNEDSSLEEGTNYFLEVNKSLNDSYACILSCQCRNRFKLPFMETGLFKLSTFYRHLKEQHSEKFSKTARGKENDSFSDERLSANQSNTTNRSSSSSSTQSNNEILTNKSSKRSRSPSRQKFSNTNTIIAKRNRVSSSNNKNKSKQ